MQESSNTQVAAIKSRGSGGCVDEVAIGIVGPPTERELEWIAAEVKRRTRTPLTADRIGVKLGRVPHRYKVGKHFATEMGDGLFPWSRREESIQQEAALDGLYVIRSSEKKASLSAADTVRCYKSLAQVEWAFRCLAGGGPAAAADLSPHARAGAGAHFFVSAGLLRGVAHAPRPVREISEPSATRLGVAPSPSTDLHTRPPARFVQTSNGSRGCSFVYATAGWVGPARRPHP